MKQTKRGKTPTKYWPMTNSDLDTQSWCLKIDLYQSESKYRMLFCLSLKISAYGVFVIVVHWNGSEFVSKTQLVSRTTLLTYFCRLVSLSVVWDPKFNSQSKYSISYSHRRMKEAVWHRCWQSTKNQIQWKCSVSFWDRLIWSSYVNIFYVCLGC